MRERKYVKLRSDMYEDTKFKIIDMKPERDTIHYIWTRLLTLAARVNLGGDLFMSRNLPYTIETLAIELNRSEKQIKLAIDVFLELEMIEVVDGRIYRIKNFAKHQNIKVAEKVKSEVLEINEKNIEAVAEDVIISKSCDEEEKKLESEDEDKGSKYNVVENHGDTTINEDKRVLEINKYNTMSGGISDNICQNSITTVPLEKKKNNKTKGKKKKDEVANVTDEDDEMEEMFCFKEGEYIPGEGETIIASWTF